MKFGLFSMVQNYLHAMRLVQREKESWSGRGNTIGADSKGSTNRACLTLERKKMIQVSFLGGWSLRFVWRIWFSFVFA